MPRPIETAITAASIRLSDWNLSLEGPTAAQPEALSARIAGHLTGTPGFCIAHGTRDVLARSGVDLAGHRDRGYALLESVFRSAMARIDFSAYAVVDQPMTLAHMDVDGYNLNGNFSHDQVVASRAFMTSKCIHFDAATPFIANVYGLNENIGGGHPVLSDVRGYCRDFGVRPADVVDAIPNNYNVVVRREHYAKILQGYTAALDVDIDTDMIVIMTLNEIEYGVAHGATPPYAKDPARPARRPLRHFEYQYGAEQHYVDWYRHYGVPMVEAADYAGENLSLDYYEPASAPFDRIVRIGI